MKPIIFLLFFLLVPLASSATTFFDNPEEFFIMGQVQVSQGGGVPEQEDDSVFFMDKTIIFKELDLFDIRLRPTTWYMGRNVQIVITTVDSEGNEIMADSIELIYHPTISENRKPIGQDEIIATGSKNYITETFIKEGDWQGIYQITVIAKQDSKTIQRTFDITIKEKKDITRLYIFLSITFTLIILILLSCSNDRKSI